MPVFRHCQGPDCHNFHRNQKYCSVECQHQARRKYPNFLCETCNKSFRPSSPHYRSRPHRFCSTDCRLSAQSSTPFKKCVLSAEEMIQSIQLYKDGMPVITIAERFQCGYNTIYRHLEKSGVQLTYLHHGSPRPKKKIEPSQQEIAEVKFLYGFGFSAAHIEAQLKTVSKHTVLRILRESGLTRNGFDPSRRFLTTDGHLVRSSAELMVDDWLYDHGIAHIYEPKLTVDPHYHADFFACGYYIELWGGGPNQKAYKRIMTKKLALYTAHNLPLISVTWEQTLKDLDTVLAPLLIQPHQPSSEASR